MISLLLKEPCFFGFIGAILSIFITLLDSYLFNEKKNKTIYCKIFILSFIIVTLILYTMNYFTISINDSLLNNYSNINLQTGTPDF